MTNRLLPPDTLATMWPRRVTFMSVRRFHAVRPVRSTLLSYHDTTISPLRLRRMVGGFQELIGPSPSAR
jgi:hypothetical protein